MYAAFLRWRAEAGFDNAIAGRLGALLADAGLCCVTATDESELAVPGEPGYEAWIGLWPQVIATRGHRLVTSGALTEAARADGGPA